MFAEIFGNIGGLLAEVTPIITSSDWDTISTTATTTVATTVATNQIESVKNNEIVK